MTPESTENFIHDIVWTDAKVSRLWDYYAKTRVDAYFARQVGDAVISASKLPREKPLEVLDFGCGPGFMWEHCQRRTKWSYTGLDFSSKSVEQLRTRAQGDVRFKGAHLAHQLPCELVRCTFDVILFLEVVEHLEDAYLKSSLTEIARLLKVGGFLVVTTPNEENLERSKKLCPDCGALFHEWQHVRSWSAASLENELAKYGLRKVHSRATNLGSHNWSGMNIAKRALQLVRRLTGRAKPLPNLVGVFVKHESLPAQT